MHRGAIPRCDPTQGHRNSSGLFPADVPTDPDVHRGLSCRGRGRTCSSGWWLVARDGLLKQQLITSGVLQILSFSLAQEIWKHLIGFSFLKCVS